MEIWHWILLGIQLILAFLVSIRIITETRAPAKTLAYLMLVFFLPVFGILLYLLVGINFRKKRLYNKKLVHDKAFYQEVRKDIVKNAEEGIKKNEALLKDKDFVARMLLKDSLSPLNSDAKVTLLFNGEKKYPALLEALEAATDHIHMEYYIFDSDEIGNRIADVLIRKAKEGVKVRVIYDDFGSKSMSRAFEKKLQAAGVEIFAFYKIYFILFARRVNYRDHRKIVVIDGRIGFLGGINISNHYSNEPGIREKNKFFWRDTHIKIEGSAVYSLQYLFLATWNFCSDQHLKATKDFFPPLKKMDTQEGDEIVQIVSSGPDSRQPSVFLSFLASIMTARERIRITTPYFIPNFSLMDALKTASLAGVKVELLVPGKSDTRIIDLAAVPYYDELMAAGVKVYRYKKGFVHAKTMTVDGLLSIVGTANMDQRSFDLNFEVNAVIYGPETASLLDKAFDDDIKHSAVINKARWKKRGAIRKLQEYLMRLLSALL